MKFIHVLHIGNLILVSIPVATMGKEYVYFCQGDIFSLERICALQSHDMATAIIITEPAIRIVDSIISLHLGFLAAKPKWKYSIIGFIAITGIFVEEFLR